MASAQWLRGPLLGRGSTATVHLAASEAATFAVKSADLASAAPLLGERDLLASLSSPHLLAFLGSDITLEHGRAFFNIHLEYAPGGSLHDRLRRAGGAGLKDPEIRSHARGILLALSYLHSRGVAHCDVKPRNIVLAADGSVRLVDFGCARRVGSAPSGGVCGTPLYMSPEAARWEEQGTPADVWALGCSVLELATGSSPWPGVLEPTIGFLHRVGFAGESPEIPGCLPPDCRDFIASCLERDPRRRPAADDLLRHPFVASASTTPLWRSPKCVLDQDVWDSIAEEETEVPTTSSPVTESEDVELSGRIRQLAVGAIADGSDSCASSDSDSDSFWDDGNWMTIRNDGEPEELPPAGTSGGNDLAANCGEHPCSFCVNTSSGLSPKQSCFCCC